MDDGADTWEGAAAAAFRASLDSDFRPQLSDVHDAFVTSRNALSGWADELSAFQTRARQLEEEARLAAGSVARRASELTHARNEALADPIAAAGSSELADADRRARAAQATLEDVRRRTRALQEEANGRANACAGLLETGIARIANYAGSGWDQFTSWLGDVGSAIADGYEWFVDNVMPILEDIIDTIGPIVAVVALFVPALGPLALGLAIASVAIDGLQALRGENGAAEEFFMGSPAWPWVGPSANSAKPSATAPVRCWCRRSKAVAERWRWRAAAPLPRRDRSPSPCASALRRSRPIRCGWRRR